MTIRNSETGDEMTITVPDGLVITSGIEGEDGDFVVTDTLYADNSEPCIVDTVACDTVEPKSVIRISLCRSAKRNPNDRFGFM